MVHIKRYNEGYEVLSNNIFKNGDIIVCSDGWRNAKSDIILKKDGLYRIRLVTDDNYIILDGDEDGRQWRGYRFRLANEDEKEMYYLDKDVSKYNL